MRIRRLLAAAITMLLLPLAPTAAITYPDKPVVLPEAAPWVVSLWQVDAWSDRDPDGYFCTGSLIDDYTVVTAAHCVREQEAFVVVRGQAQRTDYATVLTPRAVRLHPKYNGATYANDLALIDLYQPSGAGSFLKLPSKAKSDALLALKPRLYGWGRMQRELLPASLRSAMQKDKTAIADKSYEQFDPKKQIGANRIGLTGNVTAACRGDSGGPLVGAGAAGSFLLGVVSFGASTDCKSSLPVVYSRTSYYVSWIRSQRDVFSAERAYLQVDRGALDFANLTTDPLPLTTGNVSEGVTYQQWQAKFTTEGWMDPVADASELLVRSYSDDIDSWSGALEVRTRGSWPQDGCGWGVNGTYVTGVRLELEIRQAAAWRTGVYFNFQSPLNGCLPAAGQLILPIQVGPEPMSADCRAVLRPLADAVVEIGIRRSCFTDPANAYFRVRLHSLGGLEVLPGVDLWTGPFDFRAAAQPEPAA